MSKKILILSGQVCREHNSDLRSFWSGFINIQENLSLIDEELEIIAHNWNPEHNDLVKKVYLPKILRSELQPNFLPEYYSLVNPIDKFESGIIRAGSIWERAVPQALLGNAHSRSIAAGLIDKEEDEEKQVIFARWDQGQTGSKQVNKIIYDPSLPKDLIYLANYFRVDEGYADMWIILPVRFAKLFKEYKNFILESLSEKNDFITIFCKTGFYNSLLSYPKILGKLNSFILLIKKFIGRKYTGKFINNLTLFWFRVEKKISKNKWYEYGEHKLFLDENNNKSIWPIYLAINNHALLRHFIIKKKLREQVRFLDISDFTTYSSKKLINPKPFVLLVYTHSSYADCWPIVIGQAIKFMPVNCKKIILLSDNADQTFINYKKIKKTDYVELLLYEEKNSYTVRLQQALKKIKSEWEITYFIHEDMPLYAPVNSFYLNALLHYLSFSNEFYIKLIDTKVVDLKIDHPGFPELVSNTGGYSLSIQPSLLKTNEFEKFISKIDLGIYDFEKVCSQSNLKFSAVSGKLSKGKFAIINKHFPHIVTAIAKGKWCKSEWRKEIDQLAGDYVLDTKLRGEI